LTQWKRNLREMETTVYDLRLPVYGEYIFRVLHQHQTIYERPLYVGPREPDIAKQNFTD
jgi:hypothetical protein